MTSGRNIWLAGICAASVLAAGLRLGDIVPGWVFRTHTLALGTIWLRLGQQVWHRLRQRQRPLVPLWNYALPVLVAIPTLASLSDGDRSRGPAISGRCCDRSGSRLHLSSNLS